MKIPIVIIFFFFSFNPYRAKIVSYLGRDVKAASSLIRTDCDYTCVIVGLTQRCERAHIVLRLRSRREREIIMSKKVNAHTEVSRALASRRAYGRSKASDKAADRSRAEALARVGRDLSKSQSLVKENFYTRATFEKCVNEGARFLRWVRAEEGRRVSFSEAKNYIPDYLNSRVELYEQGKLSAGYLMTERAQLSKIYMIDLDGYKLPARELAIKGRAPEKYDSWKSRNSEQARFYESVGLRDFEYKFLKLDESKIYSEKCYNSTGIRLSRDDMGRCSNLQVAQRDSNGLVQSVVIAHGKHGKSRISEILPQNRDFVTHMLDSGRAYEWFAPGSHVPTQAARREYAQSLYHHYARPIDSLPREQVYCTRDGSGRMFDRQALERVSKSLGHGDGRYATVINNYLR